jgi:aspartate kinase
MKFGGTSVADPERLKAVARRIVAAREAGSRVVAVLSAMGQTTDELIDLARQVSPTPDPRELDMLISVGERISVALAAMAINDLDHEAISLTGSQAGIVTDTAHGKAKIVDIRGQRIHEALDQGKIVLVAGFQGVSTAKEITTLGRGASDTTAVALSVALGADACEIYTDVEGVYTADPRIVAEARKLEAVSYDEMLEMSACGAKVMALRSVELARNYGVRLHVRSSFGEGEGTWIGEEDERMLEKAIISGVTHDTTEAKVTIIGVPDRPGVAARVFRPLADAGVNIDMIVQNVSEHGHATISFTMPKTDLAAAEPILRSTAQELGAQRVETDPEIAKVSLIGAGMKSHPGVAADMFDALAENGINLEIISTSSIRVSCVVRASEVERAVQALHDRFELGAADGSRAGADE